MTAALVLEAASEDDVDALVSLERQCFSHPWSARSFRLSLKDPARGRVVVLRARHGPGDAERGIRAYCVFEVVADEMHVYNVAVHPAHRGHGLGRRLLDLALGLGARRGAAVAFLEARQSNWRALELYRSLGFRTVAVRRDYYEKPREDALVLEKRGLAAEGES